MGDRTVGPKSIERGVIVSSRLQRLTGVTLLLTAIAVVLGTVLGDPTIESHDDRERFVEQVENAAERIPLIYAFQVVEVVGGFLAVAAGIGLYLMLRERAHGAGLVGLVLFAISAAFEGGRAFVGAGMVRAADDYVSGGLGGIGDGSEHVLELIRVLAVLHFGNFLTAFAALGLGAGAYAYGLAWSTGFAPRWLGRLGIVASGLLVLTPLALTVDVLFLPFFFGTILTLVWLLAAGVWLTLRPSGARAAVRSEGATGSAASAT